MQHSSCTVLERLPQGSPACGPTGLPHLAASPVKSLDTARGAPPAGTACVPSQSVPGGRCAGSVGGGTTRALVSGAWTLPHGVRTLTHVHQCSVPKANRAREHHGAVRPSGESWDIRVVLGTSGLAVGSEVRVLGWSLTS